jgi:hypothetical protein
MGLAHAFNLAIIPHVEQNKRSKEVPIVHIAIANVGMEICSSKESYFNLEDETSSEEMFNLLDVVNTPRESLLRSTSHMPSNSQTILVLIQVMGLWHLVPLLVRGP